MNLTPDTLQGTTKILSGRKSASRVFHIVDHHNNANDKTNGHVYQLYARTALSDLHALTLLLPQ